MIMSICLIRIHIYVRMFQNMALLFTLQKRHFSGYKSHQSDISEFPNVIDLYLHAHARNTLKISLKMSDQIQNLQLGHSMSNHQGIPALHLGFLLNFH